jgi:hypothetical protein
LNVVGMEGVKRHVLRARVSAHVVALVLLQHCVVNNLISITHIL